MCSYYAAGMGVDGLLCSKAGRRVSSCRPCGLSPFRSRHPAWTARSTWRTSGQLRTPRGCSGSGRSRRAARLQSRRPAPHGHCLQPHRRSSLPPTGSAQSSRCPSLLARRHTALQHLPLLQMCCRAGSGRQASRQRSIRRGSPVQTKVQLACSWFVHRIRHCRGALLATTVLCMHVWRCTSSTARRAGDAQQSAATPACRRLESSLPHRTPLGQPQRVIDPSARWLALSDAETT